MFFSPIEASENITEKYKRYLKTIFEIADPVYQKQFEEQLNMKDILAKGPYLDVVDSFKKGRSLKQLILEKILPESFEKFEFPMERTLYLHQENAIKKIQEGKNIVVSTGTGSGKTESFLIPILAELAREHEEGLLSSGVRALIIYPMNALANDQILRLRKILSNYPEITYGSYTGQTKQRKKDALREYQLLNSQKNPMVNELICRDDMIENPPNILITNYAMLEYLMIRPQENIFFKTDTWKYIVLDEAHIYKGSTGIEVGMLLRRLKSSLPVKNVQYILTSATLGSKDQNEKVASFATNLCDNKFVSDDVIRAARENPKIQSMNLKKRDLLEYHELAGAILRENEYEIGKEISILLNKSITKDFQSAIYDYVVEDLNYWEIRKLLLDSPKTVYDITKAMGCLTQELEDFVTVASYAYKNDTMLLDAKYHMFIKASDSAFITLGESRKLLLTRHNSIIDHGKQYAVFEFGVCKACHSIYLLGRVTETGYFVQNSRNDSLYKQEILYLGDEISDEDEEHTLKSENIKIEEKMLCSRCGKLMYKNCSSIDQCEHDSKEYIKVYHVNRNNAELTKCVACENINRLGIIRQFFAGQEAVTSVIGTALFEELPSYSVKYQQEDYLEDELIFDDEEEKEGVTEIREKNAKQFIAFSDSRQSAAFYASYFEKTYTMILYKRLIVETLKDKNFYGNIPQFVSILQAQFEKFQIIKEETLMSEKEAWKAILSEMVDGYATNSLQNLGFYEFTVDRDEIPGMKTIKLSKEDVADIINVCIQSMMRDAAISYSILLNKKEKEFFTYNGHEGEYTLSDSGKQKYHSFIPSTANGLNKRVDYVKKVINASVGDCDREKAIKFLESLWKLMCSKEILVNEGIGYKVNTKKIFINPNAQFYICKRCKKITTYNIYNICPNYKCSGELEKVNLNEKLKQNHYYRMYQDMEIRSMKIVEHSAQLGKEKAYEYQNKFKEKKIDVLSCSTTFEMGVDVGDLETVFMRNMPPTPANYAQRAGRAGRSLKSVAYALTFCNKSNHDFTYFDHPEKMIRGKITPPIFKIENNKIAIRHIFAAMFGFFWKKYSQYFSDAETFLEKKDGERGLDVLKRYLSEEPENLKIYLKTFLPPILVNYFDIEKFGWISKLFGESENDEGILGRAALEYEEELKIINDSLEEALKSNSKVDYLRWRINNYKKENIITFLSRHGVLPKYGFPVDTVELSIWDSTTKNKLNLNLQRDMQMAISEYAPGSQIIADGNLITSQYIKKMPNKDWKQFDYIYCNKCKMLNIDIHTGLEYHNRLEKCRYCGSKIDKQSINAFIIPEFGFDAGTIAKAGLIKPKRTFNSDVSYIGYRNDIIDHKYEDANKNYELAYSQNDEMAVLNKSNFYVCKTCGYTHLSQKMSTNTEIKKHKTVIGKECINNILHKYALGYRFNTDVIQIVFHWPALTDEDQALSVLYAILRGTCSYLNLEENDIAGCLQYFYNDNISKGSFKIILYDRTPGGAGYVRRLRNINIFENVLKEAKRNIEECTCGGEKADTSCYHCLRSYSNQRIHDKLQRRYVLDFFYEFF